MSSCIKIALGKDFHCLAIDYLNNLVILLVLFDFICASFMYERF